MIEFSIFSFSLSRQDTDGPGERSSRLRHISAFGRDAKKSAQAAGEKAAVRYRFPEILGGLRGRGMRGRAARGARAVAARIIRALDLRACASRVH